MKKYTVSVPVNCLNLKRNNKEKILETLKKLEAERVFLCFEESLDSGGVYFSKTTTHYEQMDNLSKATEFFKKEGFEVAAWFWTFLVEENSGFTCMCDFIGNSSKKFVCPTDKKFVEFAAKTIKDIAACGVDMIVFNDDFRYGFFSKAHNCLCENHIRLICDKTGEKLERDELKEKIINGAKNKYRSAFLEVNKESFINFASEIRKAVDSVNPTIRMGFCAVMSSWDIDGDAYELAKTLAGKTRPFIRLIGAPYWATKLSWGNRLQDVIELNRMEKSYFEGKDIELIAEGDVWPRPRTECPASFLEGFDTAIRATQSLDGILKIALDYTSNPDYEIGYIKFHERNKALYQRIESGFSGKKNVGVRVYEYEKKVEDMINPNELSETYNHEMLFFSEAARTLACNGIPTVYEGEGCLGIAFGENARKVPLKALKKGIIIDTAAAKILSQRGIDVGIEAFGEKVIVKDETFLENGNKIIAFNSPSYKLELNPNVEILSMGNTQTDEQVPMSFTYINNNCERFLVINTIPREKSTLMRHYARGYQYSRFMSECFYALCPGHPDLYLLCSQDENEIAVGVWNFCVDPAINPVVYLGQKYKSIRFINGSGKLYGNRVELEEIPAYGFSGFVLS